MRVGNWPEKWVIISEFADKINIMKIFHVGIIAGSPRNFANPGYVDDEERRPGYHATVIPSTTTVPDPPPPPPPPVSNVTSPGDNTRCKTMLILLFFA